MAFTSANDINILQASDAAVVGAGLGDDTYVLSPSTLSANQVIRISDAQGANKLQLIGGLTIASSSVASNAVLLTLSNGAKVTVLGADTFSYEVGGNPLTGTAGTVQTYAQFATTTLGAASVPTTGTVSGTANVTIPGGSTGGGAGQAFSLTTSATADALVLTAGNDTVTGAANTLATGDVILDASTTDSDTASLIVNAVAKPTISNVESVEFKFALGSGAIDATSITGAKTIVVNSAEAGSTAATINNVKSGIVFDVNPAIQTFTLDTVDATSNTEAATVKLNGTTGTAGLTLTLDATGPAVANDVDVLTLNSTTAANTVTLGTVGAVFAATGEKIVVTGDKNLTIKTGATAASNGLAGATVEKSLTGGATLTVEYTGVLNAAHDLSKVAADKFVFSGAAAGGADVTLASGSTVQLTGSFTGAGSNPIQSKTEDGTLNLSATVTQGINTLNLTKFSTVNLDVTDTVTYNNLTLDNAATLKDANLNITGTNALKTLTLTSVTAKKINASTFEGKLEITNAQANADITLGKNDDKITLGNVAGVKVTGTAGNNEITTSGANAITVVGGTGNDTLKVAGPTHFLGSLDGGAGSNTITFTSAAAHDVSGNTVSFTNFQLIDVTATNAKSTFSGAQLTGKSLNIVGAGTNDSVDIGKTGGGTPVLIDASGINHSGLTALTMYTSNKADIIKGTKGADIIINEGGIDDIDLSAGGADQVRIASVAGTEGTKITGFSAGDTATVTTADVIGADAGSTATLAVNDLRTTKTFTKGAGASEFADLAAVLATFAAAGANETVEKNTYVFNFDGKTYALVDGVTAGYAAADDIVVEITGFSGTLHTTNFFTA